MLIIKRNQSRLVNGLRGGEKEGCIVLAGKDGERKGLFLRHKSRRDFACRQKHNTRVFLVRGKDPSGENLYINNQLITQ